MINPFLRYQAGLTLNDLFPKINGFCACGCGNQLSKARRKWYSDKCRDMAFITFAIIKGDTTIIRQQLFQIDMGACRMCSEITDNWQADHILPVIEGGAACDLSNFQTLCIKCHTEKTYKLSHHNAISSQAASIFFIRCLNEGGQDSMVLLNKSNEQHNFRFGT